MPHERLLVLKFSPLICPIFQDRAWIIAIARANQAPSPVKALEQYIAAAHIDLSEDLPLFRALANPRSREKVPWSLD